MTSTRLGRAAQSTWSEWTRREACPTYRLRYGLERTYAWIYDQYKAWQGGAKYVE